MRAKLLLQRLWKEEKNWDEELSDEYKFSWKDIERDLQRLSIKRIDRFIGGQNGQLLCFSDICIC